METVAVAEMGVLFLVFVLRVRALPSSSLARSLPKRAQRVGCQLPPHSNQNGPQQLQSLPILGSGVVWGRLSGRVPQGAGAVGISLGFIFSGIFFVI